MRIYIITRLILQGSDFIRSCTFSSLGMKRLYFGHLQLAIAHESGASSSLVIARRSDIFIDYSSIDPVKSESAQTRSSFACITLNCFSTEPTLPCSSLFLEGFSAFGLGSHGALSNFLFWPNHSPECVHTSHAWSTYSQTKNS